MYTRAINAHVSEQFELSSVRCQSRRYEGQSQWHQNDILFLRPLYAKILQFMKQYLSALVTPHTRGGINNKPSLYSFFSLSFLFIYFLAYLSVSCVNKSVLDFSFVSRLAISCYVFFVKAVKEKKENKKKNTGVYFSTCRRCGTDDSASETTTPWNELTACERTIDNQNVGASSKSRQAQRTRQPVQLLFVH